MAMAIDAFNLSLIVTNETFQNSTTILLNGMTDLDLIVDYCFQFKRYMVVLYAIPLFLVFLRWYANNRARVVPGWKDKHMKLWLWVDEEIFGFLFLACALNLSVWIYAFW